MAVTNIPGLVYQSVALAVPLTSGTPLESASASKAATRLSDPTTIACTLSLSTSFFSADCAVAGSPASSTTNTCTG